MPVITRRTGFTDTYHDSRLNHLTGTSYPATPAGNYLALYIGALPASDGTGGIEATGTRPAITLGSPTTDGSGRKYVTHASAVSSISLGNSAAGEIVGFGLFAAATGGSPIYVDRLPPFQVAANATVTISAGTIKIYAEPPTL